jgi:hypothetical protein
MPAKRPPLPIGISFKRDFGSRCKPSIDRSCVLRQRGSRTHWPKAHSGINEALGGSGLCQISWVQFPVRTGLGAASRLTEAASSQEGGEARRRSASLNSVPVRQTSQPLSEHGYIESDEQRRREPRSPGSICRYTSMHAAMSSSEPSSNLPAFPPSCSRHRPYFSWWLDCSAGELRHHLASDHLDRKGYRYRFCGRGNFQRSSRLINVRRETPSICAARV